MLSKKISSFKSIFKVVPFKLIVILTIFLFFDLTNIFKDKTI